VLLKNLHCFVASSRSQFAAGGLAFAEGDFTKAVAGLDLAREAGVAAGGADCVGPSSIVALRITASGEVVVKPGLLVNCALYHCGGKNHLESPAALM
jgi:hypothetical protein